MNRKYRFSMGGTVTNKEEQWQIKEEQWQIKNKSHRKSHNDL